MALADLMNELAATIGRDSVALEADGGHLVIDDDLIVDIVAASDEGGFIVAAAIGPVPADDSEAVYRELLEANFRGEATGGAALCIDTKRNEIALWRQFPHDGLSFRVFDRELSVFVEALSYWRYRYTSGALGKGMEHTPER